MTPRARLLATSLAAVVGAAVTVAGTRMTWWTEVTPGQPFDVGGRRARLPALREPHTVADAVPAAAAIALVLLVLCLLALLVGPRVRLGLFAGIAAGALVLTLRVVAGPEEAPLDAATARGPGAIVTVGGAIATAAAALAAIGPARTVPRWRLPESAPDEPGD